MRYHQRSAAPVREDGGYVGGDVEETDNLVATKTKEAMDLVRRLKSIAGNTARASASDPRVTGPARDGIAARTTLALTQAMAGPEAKAAVDLKVVALGMGLVWQSAYKAQKVQCGSAVKRFCTRRLCDMCLSCVCIRAQQATP